MEPTTDARAAIAALQGHEAWAIIRRSTRAGDRDTVGLVGGRRRVVESLLDVPLESGAPAEGHIADRLLAVPFRQVRERGFEAHDDGTPLVVVDVETELEFSVEEVVAAIDDTGVEFADRGGFDTDDEEYGKLVEAIIHDEIGQGEGANLVIGRHYRATVADWGADKALTVLKRLLERERGAYWTFLFFTGDRYLVGASPERHVSIHGGDVRMNPISGTFRLPTEPGADLAAELLDFLHDEKEIYELFMVVDEELKMMCDICHEGGQVLGPFLKPMSRLVHTEYLLAGRTDRDPREVLRDTMYAATVTGSPVENACRLIKQYETEGRGYYGAALAVLGRDAQGGPVVDSPIVIRTADVDLEGRLTVTAGATLVRDSDPAYEVAETHAKAGGILSAFGLVPPAPTPSVNVAELVSDEDVLLTLNQRNRRLSSFWLTDQAGAPPDPRLRGQERGRPRRRGRLRQHAAPRARRARPDQHGGALRRVRRGLPRRLRPGDRRPRARRPARRRRPEDADPARGDRRRCWPPGGRSSRSASATRRCATSSGSRWPTRTSSSRAPSHRCRSTGGPSGSASTTPSSAGWRPDTVLPDGVRVEADPETGDIHALYGPHYRGIQFHAESILTEHGYDLLHRLVADLLLD